MEPCLTPIWQLAAVAANHVPTSLEILHGVLLITTVLELALLSHHSSVLRIGNASNGQSQILNRS